MVSRGALQALLLLVTFPVTRPTHLSEDMEGGLILWLRSEEGLEFDSQGAVQAWRDSKRHGINHDFVRLPEGQHRFAFQKMRDQLARQSSVERLDPDAFGIANGQPRFTPAEEGERGAHHHISFPCGLVSKQFQLHDRMTFFFVVRPSFFEHGDQAAGQRLFGQFPYGQIRFNSGKLAFRADSTEFLLPGSSPLAAEWNIIGYRLNGYPEALVNSNRFEAMHSKRGDQTAHSGMFFSPTGFVTLGGTNADCGYIGDVREVLVFDHPISDNDVVTLVDALADYHAVPISRSAVPNSQPRHAGHGHVIPQSFRARFHGDGAQQEDGQHDRQPSRFQPMSASRVDSQPNALNPSDPAALLLQIQALQQQLTSMVQGDSQASHADAGPRTAATDRSSPGLRGSPKLLAGKCKGGDAFAKQPVDNWNPPADAPLEDIQQWNDAQKAAMSEITQFNKGGQVLRDFIHERANKLRILRHKLFCTYVN